MVRSRYIMKVTFVSPQYCAQFNAALAAMCIIGNCGCAKGAKQKNKSAQSSPCMKASCSQLAPTLGAPSCSTRSHCNVFSSRSMAFFVASAVMSPCSVIALPTDWMGTRSTPRNIVVSFSTFHRYIIRLHNVKCLEIGWVA